MVPRKIPIIPAVVLAACPDCFVPVFWRDYLETALARNTPGSASARARVDAGLPPLPCDDCTTAFETLMSAKGRCNRQHLVSLKPTKKESEHA